MESFRWGQQFLTGLHEVDEQHYELVSLVNEFGQIIAENKFNQDNLTTTFTNLAAYAQEHFNTEEQLMGTMRIDRRHTKEHIHQHADFVADILNIAENADIDTPEGSRTLLQYLVHWLAYHILGTDQNMARQLDDIQSGLSPEKAFEKSEKEASTSTQPLVEALGGLFAIVSKRNKALQELNQTLEARVAERTAELVKANEALKKISITDHLTELPNRRFAMVQLQLLFDEAVTKGQPLSCMMLDADGFKEVNDSYGHDAGDIVLKQLARVLQHCVRSDDIVCRLGGDEFIILCPNTDLKGSMHLGEQTRKRISSLQVPAGDGFWSGSVSIGVACTTLDMQDINTLLKAADEAVYEAKRNGRNCVKTVQTQLLSSGTTSETDFLQQESLIATE